MSANIKALSIAVTVIIVAHSLDVSALELPNMKRLTEEDKIYFGTRLDKGQFEKLEKVINHSKTGKTPCERAVEINKTLSFLKEVSPIIKDASVNADISSYARKYSTALVQELSGTGKALAEILPYYKNACTTAAVRQKEAGLRQE